MSLSGALSNAISGLTAASRAASVTATNIANATNENYARRELEVSAQATGTWGGVSVDGITRIVDAQVVADWRIAEADLAYNDTINTYYQRLETIEGTPEDDDSLLGMISSFETALIEAQSRPDLPERLTDVLSAAQDVASTLNDYSDGIQKLREEADSEISSTVDRLNALLQQVDTLNDSISEAMYSGYDTSSLLDHRQEVINEIAEIVPVTEVARSDGGVALYTPGGAVLVDGTVAEFGFTKTNTIVANMTRDNGLLSSLTLNGIEVNTDAETGLIGGGRLAALFSIRDDLAVDAQEQVDSAARDMILRYQDSGVDATLAVGDAGLFTDSGFYFDTADEIGIAGRIEVNAVVDPDKGGEVWRLRDGLGAATEGSSGDATLINSMIDALSAKQTPSITTFGTAGATAAGIANSLLSITATNLNVAEQNLTFSNTRESELKTRLLEDGVDMDAETQNLLLIEQAYAANARIVQTVESLLDILMEI